MGEEKSGEEVKLKAQVDSRARRTAAAHLRSPYTMDERERAGRAKWFAGRASERRCGAGVSVRPSTAEEFDMHALQSSVSAVHVE